MHSVLIHTFPHSTFVAVCYCATFHLIPQPPTSIGCYSHIPIGPLYQLSHWSLYSCYHWFPSPTHHLYKPWIHACPHTSCLDQMKDSVWVPEHCLRVLIKKKENFTTLGSIVMYVVYLSVLSSVQRKPPDSTVCFLKYVLHWEQIFYVCQCGLSDIRINCDWVSESLLHIRPDLQGK
jgi:hypothetical protein